MNGALPRLVALGLLLAPLAAPPARAERFVVTKTEDTAGTCTRNDCSLREAILAANSSAGVDDVELPAGTYLLTIAGTNEQLAATGDLDILESVNLRGQGAGTTIVDANLLERAFEVILGEVEISDLTVRNGMLEAGGGDGAGLRNAADLELLRVVIEGNFANAGAGSGGGISNEGTLSMRDSTVRGNEVNGGAGGGGVNNLMQGVLTIERTTISGNDTNGAAAAGAGISNAGMLVLVNSTVSGNSAVGTAAVGGGVATAGEMTATNVTIAGNTVTGAGAAGTALSIAGTLTLRNTIVSGTCTGLALTSEGGNLESDGDTCGFGVDDQTDVTPGQLALGPLADNGGETETHALADGSFAIDRALNATCPAQDQRGLPRPADGDGNGSAICDAGAFEAGVDVEIFADGFESGDVSAWN